VGEMRKTCNISFRKLEGKRQLGRPKRRWKENIKMDFRAGGCGPDSCGPGQRPEAGSCEHGNPQKAENFLTS
jgi:hypothetical protein